MRRLFILFAVLALVSSQTLAQPGPTPSSDVLLGGGTGFLVTSSGLVVTNHHVIARGHRQEIYLPHFRRSFQAEVIVSDQTNDLTILRVLGADAELAKLGPVPFSLAASTSVAVGQDAWTLGFPLGAIMGDTTRLSQGVVSSLFGLDDDPRVIQISNPIQPGNSGGPLFNMRGEVIGVVVATLSAKYFLENLGIVPQNVNFAVKLGLLRNVLESVPEWALSADASSGRPQRPLPARQPLEELVARMSPFVVRVANFGKSASGSVLTTRKEVNGEELVGVLAERERSDVKSFRTVYMSARRQLLEFGACTASVTTVETRPSLSRTTVRTDASCGAGPPIEMQMGFDGTQAWRYNPAVDMLPVRYSGAELERERAINHFDGTFADLRARGLTATAEGMETLNGVSAHRIRLESQTGLVRHYWIEAETGRRLQAREVIGNRTLVAKFSRFEKYEGVEYPRLVETYADGKLAQIDELQSLRHSADAPSDTAEFSIPQAGAVVVFRRGVYQGSALEPSVYLGDEQLVRMDNGRFFAVPVAAGVHAIKSNCSDTPLQVQVRAGEITYVQLYLKGTWKLCGALAEIPQEVARAELLNLKPIGADKVQSSKVLVPQG